MGFCMQLTWREFKFVLDYSREFLVLAARLNYRETAALLNISQPALSRHMQQLEKEVGAQLIER